MDNGKDIVLVVDYHAENIEYRWLNLSTGEERTGRYATTRSAILRQVKQSLGEGVQGGKVVWIMESTTGWARVKDLLGDRVRFVLANILQMPLARSIPDPNDGKDNFPGHVEPENLFFQFLILFFIAGY